MAEEHYVSMHIKVEKVFECSFCNKKTGVRQYSHFNFVTLFAWVIACCGFPGCCCIVCCNEGFQEQKVHCLNCNRLQNVG